eukprot:gene7414-526_t
MDWRQPRTFTGSLLRETAAERDERLQRERMEAEARQQEKDLLDHKRLQQKLGFEENEPASFHEYKSPFEYTHDSSHQSGRTGNFDLVSHVATKFDKELEQQEQAELVERYAYRLKQQMEGNPQRYVGLEEQAENPLNAGLGNPPTCHFDNLLNHTNISATPSAPPAYEAHPVPQATTPFQNTSNTPQTPWSPNEKRVQQPFL